MTCFTCGVPIHQLQLNGRRAQSFSTCFADERICEDCENEFERKTLPKRAIGTLAAEWKGYKNHLTDMDIKALTVRVRLKTAFTDDNFSFIPFDSEVKL